MVRSEVSFLPDKQCLSGVKQPTRRRVTQATVARDVPTPDRNFSPGRRTGSTDAHRQRLAPLPPRLVYAAMKKGVVWIKPNE